MTDGTFRKKLVKTFKDLGIDANKITHFGRDVAPAIMDMREVVTDDQKNIGNWSGDVFQNVYSTNLPLPAMRALAGYDIRRGYYKNPRTRFQGDGKYDHLARTIFPWIEADMDKLPCECTTARAFLQLLVNLRWVIIQDCAVMIGEYKRTHFIFKHMCHVFESNSFRSYTNELLDHISTSSDPNDENIERLLPGVLGRMSEQVQATKDMHDQINNHFDTSNIKVIENSMNKLVNKSLGRFATHIGNFQDFDSDNDSQLPSEKILQIKNIVKNKMIIKPVDDQAGDVQSTLPVYEIPLSFITVDSMMDHWDCTVEKHLRKHKSNWRKHLTHANKRKFSRMKKVVEACKKRKRDGEIDVLDKFQTYYSSNNHSLAKLADNFLK